MRILLAIAFVVFSCSGPARAACGTGAPATYDDIDRLLLIRCQVVSDSYPCFRLSLAIDGGQIRTGSLNAVKGIGMRGTFVLAPPSAAASPRSVPDLGRRIFLLLGEYDPLEMTLRPFSVRAIDAPFNVLVIRRCGSATILRSIESIDDADHVRWSSLLQRLQAFALNLHWDQTSPRPDVSEATRWFDDPTSPSFLEY
jgi:hypothetical protein